MPPVPAIRFAGAVPRAPAAADAASEPPKSRRGAGRGRHGKVEEGGMGGGRQPREGCGTRTGGRGDARPRGRGTSLAIRLGWRLGQSESSRRGWG